MSTTSTRLLHAAIAGLVASGLALGLSGCIPVPPRVPDRAPAGVTDQDADGDGTPDAESERARETSITESGRERCGDDAVMLVSGEGLDVEIVGSCATVEVRGNGVDVEIESTVELLIEGQGVDVDVASGFESATIRGNGNDLSGADVGAVRVSGGGNDLEFVTIGSLAIEGNDNTVDLPGEPGSLDDDGERNYVGKR